MPLSFRTPSVLLQLFAEHLTVKFYSALLVLASISLVLASPGLQKRASVNDVATVGYAALGKTTGGAGGPQTVVTTLDALTSAVTGNDPKIVIIQGTAVASSYNVGKGATLQGVGLRVLNEQNVIIRNIAIKEVLASAGDALGIQAASNVWIDHMDLSSNWAHDKVRCRHHGHVCLQLLRVLELAHPSFRFGTGHIFNNLYDNNADGINTRDGAQLLVENNVWNNNNTKPLYSTDEGFAVATGNEFDSGSNEAPLGTFMSSKVPYSYSLVAINQVRSTVSAQAGATLSF
ncbi:putative pectate lyase A [Grifola frondosa]|uniref:Putative pectate lyase A n=1 Tax=Grifola frondosa TaxID=5627 RepID=A0A1C7MF56_GRIFR|nr:putative pectate lyase A [Grifola frondosa]